MKAIEGPKKAASGATFYRRGRPDVLSLRKTILAFIAAFSITDLSAGQSIAPEKSIVVASTTSTQDSGLFGYLLPIFRQKTGITVNVLAQGTGQALDTGRRGDADVVFVHARSAELRFLAEGQGVRRFPVMYNDFVLIGPKTDPARIKGTNRRQGAPGDQGKTGTFHIARGSLGHASRRTCALEQGRRRRHR